ATAPRLMRRLLASGGNTRGAWEKLAAPRAARHRAARETRPPMNPSLLRRYAFFACCSVALSASAVASFDGRWLVIGALGALVLIGLLDLSQRRHAIRRNYPILGNLRYLVESIRPEIRQYLLEG